MTSDAPTPEREEGASSNIGFCGCVGFVFGASWGACIGVLVGALAFEQYHGQPAQVDLHAVLSALGGGLLGGLTGVVFATLVGSPRSPLSCPQLMVVVAFAALAAVGTGSSPVPSAWAWAPAGAFLGTAVLTIAAFARANRARTLDTSPPPPDEAGDSPTASER